MKAKFKSHNKGSSCRSGVGFVHSVLLSDSLISPFILLHILVTGLVMYHRQEKLDYVPFCVYKTIIKPSCKCNSVRFFLSYSLLTASLKRFNQLGFSFLLTI